MDEESRRRAAEVFGERGLERIMARVKGTRRRHWRRKARVGFFGSYALDTTLDELDGLSLVRVDVCVTEEDEWQRTTTRRLGMSLCLLDGEAAPVDSFGDLSRAIVARGAVPTSAEQACAWIERAGLGWCPDSDRSVQHMCGRGDAIMLTAITCSGHVEEPAPGAAFDAWRAPSHEDGVSVVYVNGEDGVFYRVEVSAAGLDATAVCRGARLDMYTMTSERLQPDVDRRYADWMGN